MVNKGEIVLAQIVYIFLHKELSRIDKLLEDGHLSYEIWIFYHQYGEAIVFEMDCIRGFLQEYDNVEK